MDKRNKHIWKTLSNEEKTKLFVQQSREIHGDLYDYSVTIYIKSNEKVKIICKTHGIFEQMPYKHKQGDGCPKCPAIIKQISKDKLKTKTGRGRNYKIKIDQKFARLTVIEFMGFSQGKTKRQLWKCICECGNETIVKSMSLLNGHTKSCGCLLNEVRTINGKNVGKINRKMHPKLSTAKQIWRRRYNDGNITFERFLQLSQLPCYYCNRLPFRTINIRKYASKRISEYQINEGNWTYNGLDRIDPTKGHIEGNIVPCCFDCNQAKSDMPLQDFINWIKIVYQHICNTT